MMASLIAFTRVRQIGYLGLELGYLPVDIPSLGAEPPQSAEKHEQAGQAEDHDAGAYEDGLLDHGA
jgi:hypothetical protein